MLMNDLRIRITFFLLLSLCWLGVLYAQQAVTPHIMGKVTSPKLDEISGIVPAASYPGCFWVHNDSGDDANIYLIDSTAALLHTVRLEGVKAVDFEDIAWCYNARGKYSLVVGDIGDNRALRTHIVFYMLEEPAIDFSDSISVISKDKLKVYRADYPDGPRDAEAFFVDPLTGQLVLISKRDFHVHVYTSDLFSKDSSGVVTLSKVTQLPVQFVTAADISRDGRAILVKNLIDVYLWLREPSQTVLEAFTKPYRRVPYTPEPQGEAIAFGEHSDTFYTLSERPLFLDSYLYRYKF